MFKILVIALMTLSITVVAQKDPLPQRFANPISPAPNVASLGKYGDVPVGKYTGAPDINIPLFSISVKDFAMSISASYNASGIQVAEEASFLGLGWSLNAGGVITQIVNDENDFSGEGYYTVDMPDPLNYVAYETLAFHSQTFDYSYYADCNAIVQYQTKISQIAKTGDDIPVDCVPSLNTVDVFFTGAYDTEPDVFFFNFPGYSGKFLFDKKNNKFISFKKENIVIQFDGYNDGWVLTTPDGSKFYFKAIETTHVRSSTIIYNSQATVSSKIGPDFNTFYITKIHLVTGEDILFTYTQGAQVCNLSKRISQFKVASDPAGYFPEFCVNNGLDVFYSDSWYNPLYLSEIQFPQGKLIFNWTSRSDLLNGLRLYRIDKYDTLAPSVVVASVSFDNDQYFVGHNSVSYLDQFAASGMNCTGLFGNDILFKRLKLTAIHPSNTEAPYQFQYDESVSLPSKLSYAQDYWGYYNGNDNATSLFPDPFKHYERLDDRFYLLDPSSLQLYDRSPNPNALAWLLTKMTYPTKGYSEFIYENNTYSNYDEVTYNRGRTSVHASVYYSTTYTNTTNQYGTFTLDVPQKVFVVVDIPSMGTDPYYQNAWARIVTMTDQPVWEARAVEAGGANFNCQAHKKEFVISLPAGSYKIFVDKDAGNQVCNSSGTYYSIDVSYTLPPPNSSVKYVNGPGARVSKIVDSDGSGNLYERSFDYEYEVLVNGITTQRSYGELMNKPLFYQDMDSFGRCGNFGGSLNCSTCKTYVVHGSAFNGIAKSAQGSYIGYSKVTEWRGSPSSNAGKTITEFINGSDLCVYGNIGPCIQNLANGSISTIDYYSNAGKIKSEVFVYAGMRALTQTYGIKMTDATPSYHDSLYPLDNAAILHFYPISAYRYDIVSKSTSLYDPKNDRWTTETVTYDHYDNGLVKSESKTESDGSTTLTTYNYPQNIGSAPYTSMTAMNWIDPVIEIRSSKVKQSQATEFYHSFSNYMQMPSGYTLLNKIQDSYKGGTLESVLNVLAYDSKNNPVAVVGRNGTVKSYAYDKTNTVVIAEVENSNNEPFHFAGFEDGDGDISEGHTGKSSHTGYYTTIQGLTIGNKYVLAYWSKTGGSWTMQQTPITASGMLYTIALNGQLDDVRFYPASANMTTYTFEREKGITSITDSKGRSFFYEYDSYNRLRIMRDSDGSVLKRYQYHVKN